MFVCVDIEQEEQIQFSLTKKRKKRIGTYQIQQVSQWTCVNDLWEHSLCIAHVKIEKEQNVDTR